MGKWQSAKREQEGRPNVDFQIYDFQSNLLRVNISLVFFFYVRTKQR